MKTPLIVGRYRFKIIHTMLAGNLTIAQAEELQRMSDSQIMHILRKNKL